MEQYSNWGFFCFCYFFKIEVLFLINRIRFYKINNKCFHCKYLGDCSRNLVDTSKLVMKQHAYIALINEKKMTFWFSLSVYCECGYDPHLQSQINSGKLIKTSFKTDFKKTRYLTTRCLMVLVYLIQEILIKRSKRKSEISDRW